MTGGPVSGRSRREGSADGLDRALFGISPDGGSGLTELLIGVALAMVVIVVAFGGRPVRPAVRRPSTASTEPVTATIRLAADDLVDQSVRHRLLRGQHPAGREVVLDTAARPTRTEPRQARTGRPRLGQERQLTGSKRAAAETRLTGRLL
jgi:hypothetical protein